MRRRLDPGRTMTRQPVGQYAHHLIAAIGSRQRANQRNPNLHGGQEPIRATRQIECLAGRLIALFGQLPQTAPPAGDNCHFGSGKESVCQNQNQEDEQLVEHCLVSVCPENAKPAW